MSRPFANHPGAGELLRYLDGELTARRSRGVRAHVESCWQCRAELSELERTIEECVRYRQTVLPACLPEPPAPWFDIYRKFDEIDRSLQAEPWYRRGWAALRGVAPAPRWAAAIALLVVVALIIDQFRNAPSVRASELLTQASATEAAAPARTRTIEIRARGQRVRRHVGPGTLANAPGRPAEADLTVLAGLEPLFERAEYDWNDPLSATAFAAWRAGLSSRRDEVVTVRGAAPEASRYRIRTTTGASELESATLELAETDLAAVRGAFEFRAGESVEIVPVAAMAPPPPAVAASKPASAPISPAAIARREIPEIETPATPAEELKVFAALQRLGADLGEPVEVTRQGPEVVVTGVGVSEPVGAQIEQELGTMPRVSVRLSDPAPVPAGAAVRVVQPNSGLGEGILNLQSSIEQQLGGRPAYDDFSAEVLSAQEELMAHIHALRRLAVRFAPETEAQLDEADRRLLTRLRREHAVAVAGLAVSLEERVRPVLARPGASQPGVQSPALSGAWQTQTEELFGAGRRSESLLAGILGGATTQIPPKKLPESAAAALARLRILAAAYVRNTVE